MWPMWAHLHIILHRFGAWNVALVHEFQFPVLVHNAGPPTYVQILSQARKCPAYVLNMSHLCPCLGFVLSLS